MHDPTAQSRHALQGFTLIELLVVMTIIAILVTLTVPILSNVQEKAKAAGCLSNQRIIGGALRTYASNHDGDLIPVEDELDGGESWAYRLFDLGYLDVPVDPTHTEIKYRRTPFRCPAGIDEVTSDAVDITSRDDPDGRKATAWPDDTSGNYIHCWYGINGSTWGNDRWPFVQRPLDSGEMIRNNISQVASTSRVPMIYDGWYMHNGKDERINARHARATTTNLHFFDGHGESFDTFQLPGVNELADGPVTWRM